MPFDQAVLGFSNRFSRLGFALAKEQQLAPGLSIKTLTSPYFFASKIEAYETRGAKMPYESEPGDDWIFEGATKRNGVQYAAPSQVAADLLTSPGRGPAEGAELITWMLANEEKWRQ